MAVTFEFSALHYLNQWLREERTWVSTLRSNVAEEEKLKHLAKALTKLRVIRSLPVEHDVGAGKLRLDPVLKAVKDVSRADLSKGKLPGTVERVAQTIGDAYGGADVLSLTSKALWLLFRSPVIIYDRKARDALGYRGTKIAEYYKLWNESYQDHRKGVQRACASLADVHLYCVDQRVGTTAYIARTSSYRWFMHRVFDIYLWHGGNDAEQAAAPDVPASASLRRGRE